jgi:23S rRNA G2445 N2-methylase RlmL
MKKENPAKTDYQRLRHLPCEELWREAAAFDRAQGRERVQRVGVVRAVGVVFSESGTAEQKEQARQWLRALLHDPEEKVRRYAMTALPKIGVDAREEADLLTLLENASSDRERQSLGRTLEKIGGSATLAVTAGGEARIPGFRKVEANVARAESPTVIRFDRRLTDIEGLRIHLRCRAGLEELLAEELDERIGDGAPFRQVGGGRGLVVVAPIRAFTLADVYALRCFSTAGFALGEFSESADETEDFLSRGHQRSAVRRVADRVYALCPELLNDSRNAPWQVNIQEGGKTSVELTPKLRPDPRFAYRQGDVPAASHPPLAACMARLAGAEDNETVWDPFCGSGLELIERALRGGVRAIFGTDRSGEALATTRRNLAAALKTAIPATLVACDFRDHATVPGLDAGTVSLVISNPPMGRRVPIPNLAELIASLFTAASEVLRPGGRLVFANPLPIEPRGLPLRRVYREKVDLGGFHCHLEKYVRR